MLIILFVKFNNFQYSASLFSFCHSHMATQQTPKPKLIENDVEKVHFVRTLFKFSNDIEN